MRGNRLLRIWIAPLDQLNKLVTNEKAKAQGINPDLRIANAL